MNKKKDKKKNILYLILIKVFLIILITGAYFYINSNNENSISLLAVNENNGKIIDGSIINLKLKITPGDGEIFTNLNTIKDIDTQISIINSNKIACNIFQLNCNRYNFFYSFDSNSLLLKGPSASSAIAILTAKTINNIKIPKDIAITGSLNSGGIIGNVGGVDKKIEVAKKTNFKKVLIPIFSTYNQSKYSNNNYSNKNNNYNNNKFQVIKVLDLVEAYNNFGGDYFKPKTFKINKENFNKLMFNLSEQLCKQTNSLLEKINTNYFKNNTEYKNYYQNIQKQINNSKNALKNKNYYSRGSFCYNANIDLFSLKQIQSNISKKQLNSNIKNLKRLILKKEKEISNSNYKKNIKTINDFYAYLILNNRINEAKQYLKDIEKIKLNNYPENNKSVNVNNLTNTTTNVKIKNNQNLTNFLFKEKINLYSTAYQRFKTVELWENFIDHSGSKIQFNSNKINQVCKNINKQILIKSQLLNRYNINYLNREIDKQFEYNFPISNKYLCIYNGFELNGKINTILNSIGISNNDSLEYALKLFNFTKSKLSLNSNGDFPLIPFMYLQYSGDLINQDSMASMLYSNYALSYLDLNIYLKKNDYKQSKFNIITKKLINNKVFFTSILILIGFIGF